MMFLYQSWLYKKNRVVSDEIKELFFTAVNGFTVMKITGE